MSGNFYIYFLQKWSVSKEGLTGVFIFHSYKWSVSIEGLTEIAKKML